jgi:ATP-dependent DNA helicase RecG
VPGPRQITLDTPVQYLKGVGEARAQLLANAGLHTVADLLVFFPYRYEDRRNPARIVDLRRVDVPVVLRGRVVSAGKKITPVKRLRLFEAVLDDASGTILLVWFNQPYLSDQIKKGDHLSIWGQPRLSSYGRLQIENPDWEKLDEESDHPGSIVPVYSSVAGIPPKAMRRIVEQALGAVPAIEDPLPVELRERLKVMELQPAILQLHQPTDLSGEFLSRHSPAHRRMILQEFFAFQLMLRIRRATEERTTKTRTIRITDATRQRVRRVLPFQLTRAQKRVLREIAGDLQSDKPMYRLLQGDVGSGKTIVGLIAALIVIDNGHQAAVMAPTEILAEQHYQRILQLLEGSTVRVAKLTGSTKARERRRLLLDLQHGGIDLIVGTHALIEQKVQFRSLGLAIVDEQHRFGVAQRQQLFAKGNVPDILVMTATPIPRSLALAVYGDLELSVIDELPPGRVPIRTAVRPTSRLPKIQEFVEGELAGGAQAYIVYPIIEESLKVDLKPLMAGVEDVRSAFPHRRVGLMHGRLPAEEKEETMAKFKNGELDILVSTTVIEVGIDVANASILVILDADRFGLSQLHQLRGRIGRGSRKSYCILVRDDSAPEEARQRLKRFETLRDGFSVAEEDLKLRGAGDFFGTRQSGMPRFRFGDIVRDYRLMEFAREAAIELVGRDLEQSRKLLRALAVASSLARD